MSYSPTELILHPIGIVHTPYKEKFAVPRQAELVDDGKGIIELLPPYNSPESVAGLDEFSHLWLIFQFHCIEVGKWQPQVRPPRLGGNKKVGVFASRATHRPNPLGLSKVKLEKVEFQKHGKVLIHIGSCDLVDQTPLFDIKPYLHYADSEPLAKSGYAQDIPQARLEVTFSESACLVLVEQFNTYPQLERFIRQVISQDPRPAYQRGKISDRIYGMSILEFNVRWRINSGDMEIAEVIDIKYNK